jgi:Pro-kumamolisin, activation domain
MPGTGAIRSRRGQPAWILGAGLLTCGALLAGAAGQAIASAARSVAMAGATAGGQRIPGYVPLWAYLQSQGGTAAADLGPAAASAPVDVRVYLAGRDPRGLAADAEAVSDPRSRLYRHYLSPAQVQERFGPAAGQAGSVRAWLAGAGLTVETVTAHYVAVTGTAAAAERAFGTPWHTYQADGTAQQSFLPSARLSAPRPVAAAVLAVARARFAGRAGDGQRAGLLGVLRAEPRNQPPGRVRADRAVRRVRLPASAAPLSLRCAIRPDRAGRDRRDHRYLPQPVGGAGCRGVRRPARPAVAARSVHPAAPARSGCLLPGHSRAGQRAGPRRRGRPRPGPRSQRPRRADPMRPRRRRARVRRGHRRLRPAGP